jgi:putative nucleotidyltransferase with HDIG domain
MKHMSFQIKLTIVFIVLLVFVLVVSTFFVYQKALTQQKEDLRAKLLDLAKLASVLIDGERLSQIKPELESQNTLPYKEIKVVLDNIRNIDPIIDSVYTMIKSNKENIWIFLVDSGDKRGVSAFCGERYDVSNLPEMQLAFAGPSVDKDPSRDKWGVFLSGYAPIYNKQGDAVAIIGIDVKAESIRHMQLLLAKRFNWVLAFGITFSLLLGWFVARTITNPLHALSSAVKEVGAGDLTKKVVIKTGDELEDLAGTFNKMTDELLDSQKKLHRHYLGTLKSLAQALEAKDPYTIGHSERVANYALNIAKDLGLSDNDLELIKEVCIFHDIGKIGVPERILSKPGPLTEEEERIIRLHPKVGEDILKYIEFLKPGITIVRDHHERPDGKGYPHGLKGKEIPLLALIVAVADVFDALTTDRPYRKALSKDKAIKMLEDNKGTQFDAHLVDVFVDYLKKYPEKE